MGHLLLGALLLSGGCGNGKIYAWEKVDFKRFKTGLLIATPICITISAYYTIKQNNIITENRKIAKIKLQNVKEKYEQEKLTEEYLNNSNMKTIYDIIYNGGINYYQEAINNKGNNIFIYSSCVGSAVSLLISPIFVRLHVGIFGFRLLSLFYGIGGLMHYCTHIKPLT